jgi:hypothetical protein
VVLLCYFVLIDGGDHHMNIVVAKDAGANASRSWSIVDTADGLNGKTESGSTDKQLM